MPSPRRLIGDAGHGTTGRGGSQKMTMAAGRVVGSRRPHRGLLRAPTSPMASAAHRRRLNGRRSPGTSLGKAATACLLFSHLRLSLPLRFRRRRSSGPRL